MNKMLFKKNTKNWVLENRTVIEHLRGGGTPLSTVPQKNASETWTSRSTDLWVGSSESAQDDLSRNTSYIKIGNGDKNVAKKTQF